MPLRPIFLTGLLAASVLLASQMDWSFAALRIWMTASQPLAASEPPYEGQDGGTGFMASALTDELKMPWSFSFLPSGEILVSERRGSLQRLAPDSGKLQEISGVPEVYFKARAAFSTSPCIRNSAATAWFT